MNIHALILLIVSVLTINSVHSQETVEPQKEVILEDLENIEDAEEVAQYPGGTEAFIKFLQENLFYPQSAIEKNKQGKCYLTMIIDQQGNVSEVKVVKGVPKCPECDAEALRVVNLMPRWIPGKKDGKPVRTRFQIPINFKLT